MRRKGIEVVISELEQEQLLSMSRSRSLPHSPVRRAKIVLMAADGHTNQEIAMQCEVTSPAITHWKRRFVAHELASLHDALVLCVDEKSQCQALERTQPMLPMGLCYLGDA